MAETISLVWPSLCVATSALWLACESWARRDGRVRLPDGDAHDPSTAKTAEDKLLRKLGSDSTTASAARRSTPGRLVALGYAVQIGIATVAAASERWSSATLILCWTYVLVLQEYRLCHPPSLHLRKHQGFVEATCVVAIALRPLHLLQLVGLILSIALLLWTLIKPSGSRPPSPDAEAVGVDAAAPPSPLESHASALSLALVAHEDKFVFRSAGEQLSASALPQVPPGDEAANAVRDFRAAQPPTWARKRLFMRLVCHFRSSLFKQHLWSLIRPVTILAPPVLLRQLLGHLAAGRPPRDLVKVVAAMAVSQLVASIAQGQIQRHGRTMAVRARAIVVTELFGSTLRTRSVGLADGAERSLGRVHSLMSVDAMRVGEIWPSFSTVTLDSPLVLILSLIYLWTILGVSVLAGILAICLLLPLKVVQERLAGKYESRWREASDERLSLVSSVFPGIRLIKLLNWQQHYGDKMRALRSKELASLRLRLFSMVRAMSMATLTRQALGNVVLFGLPIVVALSAFLVRTQVLGLPLDSATAFSALSVFAMIASPLDNFAVNLTSLGQAVISCTRIQKFLERAEAERFTRRDDAEPHDQVRFSKASFAWSSDPSTPPTLHDLDVAFPRGRLSLIIGPIGSGKTAALLALLGELRCVSGSVSVPSVLFRDTYRPAEPTVAYCAQSPFLLSDTLEANICFGLPVDEHRLRQVIYACALEDDLRQFAAGIHTQVGQRGLICSGGQKARISLARALYSSAQTLLLDDICSAVDHQTAQHLLRHALGGPLAAHRTIILATHAVELCRPHASMIVSFARGRIVQVVEQPEHTLVRHITTVSLASVGALKGSGEVETVADETQDVGRVPLRVYRDYVRAAFASRWGSVWSVIVLGVLLSAQASQLATNLSLRAWAGSFDGDGDETGRAARLYSAFALVSLLGMGARTVLNFARTIVASRVLHDKLVDSLLGARIRWLDVVPLGRIINRLSSDVQILDLQLAIEILFSLLEILTVLTVVVAIVVALPVFGLAILIGAIPIFFLYRAYLDVQRSLRRIENITRSPVHQLFNECLAGVVTIRAYSDGLRFLETCLRLVDENARPFHRYWAGFRWLAVRIDAGSALLTFALGLFVSLNRRIDSATAGFVLAYALTLQERVFWSILHSSMLEVAMASMQRIDEYTRIETESMDGEDPPASWPQVDPSEPLLVFDNVSFRYDPALPRILKDISFAIHRGERIGVIGRTGSGKSTVLNALFRTAPLDSGSISIAGLDAASLPLGRMRDQLAFVPQDVQLFGGNIRDALDPLGTVSDDELVRILTELGLYGDNRPITSLDAAIDDADSLSAGERQLVCLARGLVRMRSASVLVLDEASSSLDADADATVQAAIRRLEGVTVITIAHRLKSVADYSKILVLAQGHVVEFDSPAALLDRSDSPFVIMARASGDFDEIDRLARGSAVLP